MDYLIICTVSLIVSMITLFSGFGLGTVLMPAFALFFPLPTAIIATAVVHFANNIFKAALVGKWANGKIVLLFGIPAAITSAIGAYLLGLVSKWPPIATYQIQNHEFKISIIGITIGLLIILSSFFDLIPTLSKFSFSQKYIPWGGALSGLFGGLSGHQGMFRSAFLIKSGLNQKEFIGTGVVVSLIVDSVRLLVYGWAIYSQKFSHLLPPEMLGIFTAASLTAFAGSYIGAQFMHQITFRFLQILVGLLLLILGAAISLGLA
jgi:uncharacterized membrane protein YfcA